MPALKSDNPLNAMINLNFVIKVQNPGQKTWQLTTARKCILFIKDEKLKLKLFDKVLDGKAQQYTFKIRNRLTIKFHSK